MNFGVDITCTRLDDLDKRLLAEVKNCASNGGVMHVLDLGCGQGGLSIALALAGARVTALDVDDYKSQIKQKVAKAQLLPSSVQFINCDIETFLKTNDIHFDVVVMQRVLHYLPYDIAKKVLKKLRNYTDVLYLSVTGTQTAIAGHYDALVAPIETRWGRLDRVGEDLFSITAPLCLYSEIEIMALLHECGWKIEWSRVSDFGNIKIEAKSRKG